MSNKSKEYQKCTTFLNKNGWKVNKESSGDFISYYKEELINIDINSNEMVFLDDSGDFLLLPTNYYSLIGVLIEYRQIGFNYKAVQE